MLLIILHNINNTQITTKKVDGKVYKILTNARRKNTLKSCITICKKHTIFATNILPLYTMQLDASKYHYL